MRPFTTNHLTALAEAYCAATGTNLHALGKRVAGNGKLFKRLAAGFDCTSGNAEAASEWFAANWPDSAPWPQDVPPPERRVQRRVPGAAA